MEINSQKNKKEREKLTICNAAYNDAVKLSSNSDTEAAVADLSLIQSIHYRL